jgi:molybdenum cofactor biosynthesis enzyme MoaA
MRRDEIDACQPDPLPDGGQFPLECARRRIEAVGCGGNKQQMGRHWTIGCVALEITQRCNLDCTLCYLSDNSEAIKDLPIREIFRRIDLIYRYYGKNTDIQITGGEPTLRRPAELLSIVRRIHRLGMRTTLMTNGMRLKRPLLEALAAAGLVDVAFHVDTTQRRKGYSTEVELNALRQEYINRARGLPVCVIFNTTVHTGNLDAIPELVRFFVRNADVVQMASFQLQADTGRGIAGKRPYLFTQQALENKIKKGAGTPIDFGTSLVGHPECNRFAACLVANGKIYEVFDNSEFIHRIQSESGDITWDRRSLMKTARHSLHWIVRHPGFILPGLRWAAGKAWQMRKDLLACKGRIHRLSFLTHNFMDVGCLQRDRIDACVFKVMTRDGPLSMCLHNARRDDYILQPVMVRNVDSSGFWQPLTGMINGVKDAPGHVNPDAHPLKHLKGRARLRRLGKDTASPM